MHLICDEMGITSGRGRQTELAQKVGLSPNAARKWLLAQGMPELEMAVRIANWADVNVIWLLQGKGPRRGDKVDTRPGELVEAVNHLPDDDSQQVFDFIRYKMERADGWFTGEKLTRYMAMLDEFKKGPKAPKK